MNPQQFILAAESYWERQYTPPQQEAAVRVLRRLSDGQRERLSEQLQERSKFLPKAADIRESAEELGFFARSRTRQQHTWERTDCPLCEGRGLLSVLFEAVRTDGKLRFEFRSTELGDYKYERGRYYFTSIYRCACSAGDAETLPRAYPKWRVGTAWRYQELGSTGEPPTPEEMAAAREQLSWIRAGESRDKAYERRKVAQGAEI